MKRLLLIICQQLLQYVCGPLGNSLDTEGILRDYCEKDVFRAQCSAGEVVLIEEARYGRMRLGTCIKEEFGSLDCYSDIKNVMDQWCSGKQSCQVDVILVVRNVNPCSTELRSFLQARYSCLSVADSESPCCQGGEISANLKGVHGYIASSVAIATGCGNIDCPWHLKVPKGQKIKINLYDFATLNESISAKKATRDSINGARCLVYAILKEFVGTSHTICAGHDRLRNIYTTSSNTLDVHIVGLSRRDEYIPNFIIEYEALGCPDPISPAYGSIHRSDDRARIHCHSSEDETWEIICHDGQWNGDFKNCTIGAPVELGVGEFRINTNLGKITPGILMTLIISLAIITSVAIVTVGIVCLKRHLHQQDAVAITHTLSKTKYSQCEKAQSSGIDTIQKRTLLSQQGTIYRKQDIPWYLTRPLPNPDIKCDIGYLTDNGYESPNRPAPQHDIKLDDIEYYELDPASIAFAEDSGDLQADDEEGESDIYLRKHRRSLPDMPMKDWHNHKPVHTQYKDY